MRIYKKVVFDMQTLEVIEESSFDYDGPLCLAGGGDGGGGDGPAPSFGLSADMSSSTPSPPGPAGPNFGLSTDMSSIGQSTPSASPIGGWFSPPEIMSATPFTAAIDAMAKMGSYATTGVAQGLTGRGQGGNVGDYGGGGGGGDSDIKLPEAPKSEQTGRKPKPKPPIYPKIEQDRRKRIGRQETILTRGLLSEGQTHKPTLLGE